MIIQSNLKYAQELIPLNLDNVKYIILHSIDAVTATPEQIHEWHLKNGWAGFGYNEYIRKNGDVVIGRGDHIGAQCAGMNSRSYGIACEGDYDTETTMPIAQFHSLVDRVLYNKDRFKNVVEVGPHSRYYATSCPAKFFPFNALIGEVNKLTVTEAIKLLESKCIINSPDYWTKVTLDQTVAKGENVAKLIQNFAEYIK